MSGYDVFISHSSRDKPWIDVLVSNLKSLGIHAWYDRDRIDAGDSIVNAIECGLDQSGRLIVAVSPGSMSSPWVRREFNNIVTTYPTFPSTGKIVPVILYPTPKFGFLSESRHIDFHLKTGDSYREALIKLAERIKSVTQATIDNAHIEEPPGLTYHIPVDLWQLATGTYAPLFTSPRAKRGMTALLKPPQRKKYSAFINAELPGICAAAYLLAQDVDSAEPLEKRVMYDKPDLESEDPETYENLLAESRRHQKKNPGMEVSIPDLEKYIEEVIRFCREKLVNDLIPDAGPIDAEKVYVKLLAREWRSEDSPRMMDRKAPPLTDSKPRTLEEFIHDGGATRWTLQGDPGSGKTTLLLNYCLQLCERARDWLRDPTGAPPPIPVYVRLRRWSQHSGEILEYLALHQFNNIGIADLPGLLTSRARKGGVTWLFDGLDEVEPENMSQVKEAISRLSNSSWCDTCITIMTSRRFGYDRPDRGFTELELLPLDEPAQLRLLENLLQARRAEQGVMDEIKEHDSIRELAGNPFFLTLLAFASLDRSENGDWRPLPARRARLMERIIDMLAKGRPSGAHSLPNPSQELEILENVSYNLTNQCPSPFSRAQLEELMCTHPKASRVLGNPPDCERYLTNLARCRLLVPDSSDRSVWEYPHRSFQEFLAARELKRRGEKAWITLAESLLQCNAGGDADKARLARWGETFAFLAGDVAHPADLLKLLMKKNADLGWRALTATDSVSGDTLTELLELARGGDNWDRRRDIIRSIPERLGTTMEALRLLDKIRSNTYHGADLFFIAETYARIAARDGRLASAAAGYRRNLFKHLEKPPETFLAEVRIEGAARPYFKELTGGTFHMGSPTKEKGRYPDEPDLIEISLSAFSIGVVPVTNELYEHFSPSHSKDRESWESIPADEPVDDHPVVNVTWYEAVSFCWWATEVLRQRGMGDDEEICLPSEAQWEYACRAGTASRFHSGDSARALKKVGWFSGNSNGRTHRVALLKKNDFDLYDMHGNVWEWCRDGWSDPYEGGSVDPCVCDDYESERDRVVRGGCWSNDADLCRSAFRGRRAPGYRYRGWGFRLVRGRRRLDIGFGLEDKEK
ncbi:SUMF1/EgtB/PvdO family nonheme iron enzyme [bacterium]|nr:SUMF1/EgtB/PvdO family nonheme iron enzyme [candidate division CSSED10-310 bacterium]